MDFVGWHGGLDHEQAAEASGPGTIGCMTDPGIFVGEDGVARCWWAGTDSLYNDYHDNEWGFPVQNDTRLFEKLCLEGFQAGLAWITILRKRENFRVAFAEFDVATVASFGSDDVERLLGDAGIVRHRGKIESTINNAARALELVEEYNSISNYVWQYAEPAGVPPSSIEDLPASTAVSTAFSKDLKRRGWSFVGPTTAYAFMQAMGLVNDHLAACDIRQRCTP